MNVSYNINADCKLDAEVKDIKTCFAFVAYVQSVFGTKRCGNCESPNLAFCHRTPQGYEYYSVQCRDCQHELKFGQQKDSGRLFPKGWGMPYGDARDSRPARATRQDESGGSSYDDDPAPRGQRAEPAHAHDEIAF